MEGFKYKCYDCDAEKEVHKVTCKYVEGKGVVDDVKCDKCNDYMEHVNPKEGAPKFRQRDWY
tara:strand:- start:325 stop:510 length:186 start_codon:yes stop_codon:yes gene_type:complete